MIEKIYGEILCYFPIHIRDKFGSIERELWDKAKEIRVRCNKRIRISCFDEDVGVDYVASCEDVIRLVENFSENSLYKVQNEINNGFLTIKGGHRVGVSGTCVFENGKIKNIKYISSINIRIARQVIGCSKKVLDLILDESSSGMTLRKYGYCFSTWMRENDDD